MKIKKYTIIIKSLIVFLFLSFFFIPNFSSALTLSPPRVEFEADPGTSVLGKIKLINDEGQDKILYSSFENFEAKGETGTPSFIESTEDLAGWITTDKKIILKAGEETVINYYINIPTEAEAGGHFAAIFWNTSPPENTQIAVGAKIGMLILLRVSGDIREEGGILEFSTKNNQKFYNSLPVDFYYRFQNSGADRAKPNGEIKIKNIFGLVSERINANPVDGNVLPQSIRRFETSWGNFKNEKIINSEESENFVVQFLNNVKNQWSNFAFGKYKANLNITYGSQNIPASAYVNFWVVPWHLLLVIILILVILILLSRRQISKYNKWIVQKAIQNIESSQPEDMEKIENNKLEI